MKILLIVPEYPPYHVGGGGEVFKNLAENYKKLGHDIVVIYGYYPTISWWEDIREYTDSNDIKFYQIPEIPFPKSIFYLRTAMPPNVNALLKLKNIIKYENPGIVHIHGYGLIFINILADIVKRLEIDYIFTIHGYPEKLNRMNLLARKIWNLYIYFVMNRTLNMAKGITCISNYIKNDKRNICQNKSITIYNGLCFDEYRNYESFINIRKIHHIGDNSLIILSIGRISEMKGFQEVIKLIPKFLEKNIDTKYLIVGRDDGYKEELEKLSKKLKVDKYIEFVGFIDFELKKQYIKQCDIFAIPSLWEPFGLVALEGMIFSKVILTTDIGGLKEVLYGYEKKVNIFDDGFIEQLDKKNNVKTNFDFKKFDWENIARTYLDNILC